MRKTQLTFGCIVGTRGCFSAELARTGRAQLLEQLNQLGHKAVILPADETPSGAVETVADARKCADLFNQHRRDIDGVIVSLPNFGDELGVVNALHNASLNVPVLVQASDDELDKLDTRHRRDAFCGKLSVCNNLWQYGIPFTDTATHTVAINSPAFTRDLRNFAAICRVVGGLRHARIGAIGTRPDAFQTMRVSEKLLQRSGITTIPVDLSDLMAAASKVDITSARASQRLDEIKNYGSVAKGIAHLDAKFEKHLRLYLAIEDWIQANNIDAAGIQCWTSVQQNYGCATCLTMAMMGDRLLPCACEVDVAGVAAMYALVLASGNAAAIMDWNNNYGDDRDKCVAQHCGNYPKSFIGDSVEIDKLSVLSTVMDPELCFGAINGKAKAGPMTYLRLSTDDFKGRIRGYVGEGEFTEDPFNMLGSIAVCRVPHLQQLMKFICRNGFEHHCALVRSHVADIIQEAVTTYFGWDIYTHQ
ncbi:MAG TPA: L-fucose/L-arabinose isomerase family protein [Candidatus Paceibacterota bacterium]|nr:L-fucose/L-arabinose isomerase family protein [Verrucomicrobiota bacterium]HRY47494.1 L-fucose/L-arabinose isomerase family protein [Candidatus Paceibacterota bacterium]